MCFNSGIECNQRNHHYGSVLLETTNGDAFGGVGGRAMLPKALEPSLVD